MPQYVSCVDLSNVSLGWGAASALTTGSRNVCLGPGAGRGLTTGSGNVILGAAAGDPGETDTIVLSTGTAGTVRARWTADGDTQLAVRPRGAGVPDPPAGFATLDYDPTTACLGVRYHDGTAVRVNRFHSDAEIAALTGGALVDADPDALRGTSLIANGATRSLKRLRAGDHVTLDATTDPAAVILHGAVGALADLSDVTVGPDRLAAPAAGAAGPGCLALGPAAGRQGTDNTCVGVGAGASLAADAVGNVLVGRNAGAAVVGGDRNVLLGAGAGAALPPATDGAVILGGYAGADVAGGALVLANGAGAVRARWTPGGDAQIAVRAAPDDPPPGFATLALDADSGQLAVRVHDGSTVRTARMRTDAELTSLVTATVPPLQDPGAATAVAGDASLVLDGVTHSLKRLRAGTSVTLDTTTDPTAVIVSSTATPPNLTTTPTNTFVGFQAGGAATGDKYSNVGCGVNALSDGASGTLNVAVGNGAGRAITGQRNVCVGTNAGQSVTTGDGNVLLGHAAGAGLSAGSSNNVILGPWPGSGTVSGATIIAGGATLAGLPTVLLRWDGTGNGVHRCDGGTISFGGSPTTLGFTATLTGMTGGAAAAYTVECTNERPVNGTAILAALTLDATHRNRFTPIAPTTATTVTLLPYAGIVTGSEHEFFHNGAGYVVTFVEGPGTTIRSVANRRTLTSYGAATAKYVGGGVFALIGALEL